MGNGITVLASGIDLREPLGADVTAKLVNVLDTYPVVVFHDQPLTQAEQIKVAEQFGPLDTSLAKLTSKVQARLENSALLDVSNLDTTGAVGSTMSPHTIMNIGNMTWHSDSSYMEYPIRYSMLSAQTVAEWGGETQWADLRAAYDALDDRTKEFLEHKVGEHYALHSRMQIGINNATAEHKAMLPPVHWPMIRTHPGSGRKVLFIGSHVQEIIGMSIPEGRVMLLDLLEHATQPAFVYTHKWQVNDFVIWDNRATIHRGRRHDLTKPRAMRRVATVDDVRSLPIVETRLVATQ